MQDNQLFKQLKESVRHALDEDIGSGDISSEMINQDTIIEARVICRESAVICGQPWVDEVFHQLDPDLILDWQFKDGESCLPDDLIFSVTGQARSILTGERTALNFLQVLSGTASTAREYADLVKHTPVKILDTRKTIPGLRLAQKYAVSMGGCFNHRLGLYDAFLLKENHITACGGIPQAVAYARARHPDKPVEVEVETLAQLKIALAENVDTIMLDNFDLETLKAAVSINQGKAKLEASGGYDTASLVAVAETGVDYISIGSLTKHCRAIDFSMRFSQT